MIMTNEELKEKIYLKFGLRNVEISKQQEVENCGRPIIISYLTWDDGSGKRVPFASYNGDDFIFSPEAWQAMLDHISKTKYRQKNSPTPYGCKLPKGQLAGLAGIYQDHIARIKHNDIIEQKGWKDNTDKME